MVMAQIYALVGEDDKALDELEYVLTIPAMATPKLIEADPIFKDLIDTPRFREIADNFNPRASL
jgi:hypothetical protein